MAMAAATTTTMAGARDATDTSRAPGMFFIFILLMYFLGLVMAATSAATAAGARDATRLEPLVCIFFILFFVYFIYITLIFLGPLNVSKRRLQQVASNNDTRIRCRVRTMCTTRRSGPRSPSVPRTTATGARNR